MSQIELHSVSSSNVDAVGYDEASKTLRVKFLNGAVYDYADVSEEDYEALRSASSVGCYLNKTIKKKYAATRV